MGIIKIGQNPGGSKLLFEEQVKRGFEGLFQCGKENTQVEQEACLPYIHRIPIIADDDAFIVCSRAVIAIDLGKTGYAGSHQVPERIGRNYKRKADTISHHVRPGPDHTHLAQQYIYKLR